MISPSGHVRKKFFRLVCKDVLIYDSHAKFGGDWTSILGNMDMAWLGQINELDIRVFLCLPLFLEENHLGGIDLGDQSISSIPTD